MGKTVITAAEIQQAAASGQLVVPAGAIVTPLACDLARDLGVQIVTGGQPAPASVPAGGTVPAADDELSARVRAIVAGLLAAGGAGVPAAVQKRPVRHASIREARLTPFPYPGPPPEMSVNTVDVVTADDGSPVAAGYMTLTKGSFPWTLTYDEVQIVLSVRKGRWRSVSQRTIWLRSTESRGRTMCPLRGRMPHSPLRPVPRMRLRRTVSTLSSR